MNVIETILALITVAGCAAALWVLIRIRRWKGRLLVAALGVTVGAAGLATVFGYHEICCVNYRLSGEYKRGGNGPREWEAFAVPLATQVVGIYAIYRMGVRRT